jgi:hypothetical protein
MCKNRTCSREHPEYRWQIRAVTEQFGLRTAWLKYSPANRKRKEVHQLVEWTRRYEAGDPGTFLKC